jgi:hypothetical protein
MWIDHAKRCSFGKEPGIVHREHLLLASGGKNAAEVVNVEGEGSSKLLLGGAIQVLEEHHPQKRHS